MLKNPVARCAFRLLTLAVMLGALTFLVSTQNVNAGTIEECDTQYGFCLYQNCLHLSGAAYALCAASCDAAYEQCRFDPAYQDLPAPYPVINTDYSTCLQACAACSSIPDIQDRLACYTPCWEYCDEHFDKPGEN